MNWLVNARTDPFLKEHEQFQTQVAVASNWFKKLVFAQSLAPTYTGVGHGYRWNEKENKYQETWQSPDRDPVLLWYYEDGQIREETRTRSDQPHWSDIDDARGRIETGTGRGSVTFNYRGQHDDSAIHKNILRALVSKYPGVKFGIYEKGGPYSIQQYWGMLESGKV